MNKLIDSGTIHNFVVYLSFEMADVEAYLAMIAIEGVQSEEAVLEVIVDNPHVFSSGLLSDGTCIVFAEYEGSNNESAISSSIGVHSLCHNGKYGPGSVYR